MAIDLLQQLFGGNPQRQQEYADFLRRYQDDPNSISDEEAARRYREMMRNAPHDLADEANERAFGQLPDQDRRALAEQYRDATRNPSRPYDGYDYDDDEQAAQPRNLGRLTRRAEEQDPDLFGQLFGQDSPLNSTLGKAALAGAAAFLASRVLSGQQGGGGIGLPGFGPAPGQPGGGGSIPGLNTGLGDSGKKI